MKKTICFFCIVLLIIGYGCSGNKSDDLNGLDISIPPLQTETPGPIVIGNSSSGNLPLSTGNPDLNSSIEIYDEPRDLRLILSYQSSVYRSYKPSNEFVDRWEDYIADKYDLDLEVVYHKTLLSSQLREAEEGTSKFDIAYLNELTKKGGLVYVRSSADLIELYNLDLILPLDEYSDLKDEINVLDNTVIRAVSNSDGIILGYPMMQKTYASYRIYNGDWLSKWGKPVPKTLDEFTEFARFVRNEDPDGDGEKNTYVMRYSNMILREFADIFRAFGCYTYNYGPFGYDPSTGNIENCFAGDGFRSALAYIKKLKDEDLLFDSMTSDAYKTEHPHGFGTAFMIYDEDTDVTSSTLEAGFFLYGPNTENLIPVNTGYGSIAVLKGTENAAAKLNKFIDIFKQNPNAYIDFELGIEGETYQAYDKHFYSLFSYENEVWNKMDVSTDIGIDSESYKPTVNVHYLENQPVDLELSPSEIVERTLDLYKINLSSMNQESTGLTYKHDIDNYTNELHMMNIKLSSSIIQQLKQVMNGEKSIGDAANSLTTIVISLGFQDAIDGINYDRQNY